MSDYNLEGLEELENAPSKGVIVERIYSAAQRATVLLRALGIEIADGCGVPTMADVSAHLRDLTSEAIKSYLDARAEDPSAEIEGCAGDELFEVSLADGDGGVLDIDILMRLV